MSSSILRLLISPLFSRQPNMIFFEKFCMQKWWMRWRKWRIWTWNWAWKRGTYSPLRTRTWLELAEPRGGSYLRWSRRRSPKATIWTWSGSRITGTRSNPSSPEFAPTLSPSSMSISSPLAPLENHPSFSTKCQSIRVSNLGFDFLRN